ncbi:hypothetical protein AB0B94_05495, partial [Micromonospora sp. NPDC048986]
MVLYDYGGSSSKLWVLRSTGSGYAPPESWWESTAGNWSWSSSKLVAGNFTNDSVADVAIMYDYGGSTTTLWVLPSTGSAFTAPQAWWRSSPG